MLGRRVPKFRTADANLREKMVGEAADRIESTWAEDVEFDRDAVICVCDLLATLSYSQILLAYSPIFLRQS